MRKRILAVLMTVVMLLGTCVVSVSAAEVPGGSLCAIEEPDFKCDGGENCTHTAVVAMAGNTAHFNTLQGAVYDVQKNFNFEKATITLLKDVTDGTGVYLYDTTNTRDLTIDFAGHTYTGAKNPVGDNGTESQLFHFNAPKYNINMLNGRVRTVNPGPSHTGSCSCSADVKNADKGKFKMLIQNYSNLTLNQMTVDFDNAVKSPCMNNYAVSNNAGKVNINNSRIWTMLSTVTAVDVCKTATVTIYNSFVDGDIEVSVPSSVTSTVLTISDNTQFEGSVKKAAGVQNVVNTPNRDLVNGIVEAYVTFTTKEGYMIDENGKHVQYLRLRTENHMLPYIPTVYVDGNHAFNGFTYKNGGSYITSNYIFYFGNTLYADTSIDGNNIFNTEWNVEIDNVPYLLDKAVKVTTSSNEGGEISFNKTRAIYYYGDTLNGKVTVEDGYELESFQVNGVDYALKANNTFSMKITKDTALVATFKSTAPVTEDAAADTTVEVEAEVTEEVVEEEASVEAAPVVKSFSLASMSR